MRLRMRCILPRRRKPAFIFCFEIIKLVCVCTLKFAKVPSISVVEQDIDHCTLCLVHLAGIVPEFHLEKQRHSTVPCAIKR